MKKTGDSNLLLILTFTVDVLRTSTLHNQDIHSISSSSSTGAKIHSK